MRGVASLRQRLLRQFLLLTLLPIAALTLLGVLLLTPALIAHGEERNRELASAVRDLVQLQLEIRLRGAEQLASDIRDGSIGSSHTDATLQSLVAADRFLQAAYLVDKRGIVTHAALPKGSGLHAADYLGLDESARPHFIAATSSGQAAWSETLLSTMSGQVTMVLAAPAGHSTVMIEFSLAGLSQSLADMGHGAQTLTMVLDAAGRVVGHPDARQALRQENMRSLELVQRALGGHAETGQIQLDGVEYLAYALPVYPIGWTVLVAKQTQAVLAPLLRLGWLLLSIVCITVAAAVAAARWLAARAGVEVRRLTEGAQTAAIGGGEPPQLDFDTAEFGEVWGRLRTLFHELHLRGAQAQAARHDLQSVLDAATEVAIIATDTEGTVTVFSVGAQKMLRMGAAAVVGRNTPALWHDAREVADRGAVLTRQLGRPIEGFEVFVAQARHGGYEVRDWTFVRADGERLLVSLAVTAMRDTEGALKGFLGVAVDITHRLRVEALELAQRSAEAASQAKSDFLSRMSHELRSPLNAMLGYAQLIEMDTREPAAPGQVARVQQIQRAGWHLVDLIDDVLDLSRIESGQLRVSIEPVDTLAVAARAAEITAPLRDRYGVSFTQCWIGDTAAQRAEPVIADTTRLTQVLVNLVSNAAKYNRPGGSVRLECEPLPGRLLALRVIDSGRGMSEEQVAQLFQPFNRLGLESSVIEGTGIGLVITRRLVELMGGTLQVESAPGAGSTFTVILPKGEWPAPVSSYAALIADAPATDLAGRVLYIEDNEVNAILMREVLRQRPAIELLHAGTVREGLDLARRHRPHLVLLDMHLPDAHGSEAFDALLADPLLSATPVIVVSADATRQQVAAMMRRGARGYLTKPINVAEALSSIDTALREQLASSAGEGSTLP